MSFSRSVLRHACFRAKKNVATPENEQTLSVIKPLLQPHQKWSNFSVEWDIVVDRAGKIVVVIPESDYDYVHSACLEISFLAKRDLGFDSLDLRAQNVKACVESNMLSGIMTWQNYNTVWGVTVDKALRFIETKLFNVASNQIEVTEEMIQASKRDGAGLNIEIVEVEPITLTPTPMTEEQKQQFHAILNKIENPKE